MLRSGSLVLLCPLMVALAGPGVAPATAGEASPPPPAAAPGAPADPAATITPETEAQAIKHWNEWINAPGPNDPTPEELHEQAVEVPGDEDGESELDRLNQYE